MKKALALLLAMSMIFAVFAEDVAIELAEFKGEASLDWVYDLDDSAFGFKNAESADLKFKLFHEVEKVTEGDGVWGELKIKTGGNEKKAGEALVVPTVEVKDAKIHVLSGDVGVTIDIKNHGLGLWDICLPTAVLHENKTSPKNVAALTGEQGFTTEITTSVVDAKIVFADNGVAKDKKFGFLGQITVKPIDDLNVKAGFAYNGEAETTAFAAGAEYKMSLNDKMFVKTGVEYSQQDKAKDFGFGLLFGWGADGIKPDNFFFTSKGADDDHSKMTNGASVVVKSGDFKTFEILAGIYDSTLVSGLEMGASFNTKTSKDADQDLTADVRYGTAVDIFNLSAKAGFKTNLAKEKSQQIKFECEASTSAIVANTDLYVKYGTLDITDAATKKGAITVGAKIHF